MAQLRVTEWRGGPGAGSANGRVRVQIPRPTHRRRVRAMVDPVLPKSANMDRAGRAVDRRWFIACDSTL